MSDRSYLAVHLNQPLDSLPPAVDKILADHDDRHGEEFIWEETLLGHGDQIAEQLRAAVPDLEFTCQQDGRYETDGYRITAVAGQPLREVGITNSGAVIANPHTIAALLGASTSLDGARAAVIGYLEAEGAL